MAFNPDEYLAKKQAQQPQAFDPDKYLQSRGVTIESTQPETPKEESWLDTPGMRPLAEFASSANRSITEFIDFLGPKNVNAILELSGSEARVPTLTGSLESTGIQGGFMEPGLVRDAIQAGGQLLPVAAGLAPVKGRDLATVKGAIEEVAGLGSAVTEPVKTVTKAAAATVSDALPSKARDAAKLPLYRQSGDLAAAGFKLDDAGRVVKDAVQQKALKAGIDEGAVAMIASANKATKGRMKEMIDVLEKGRGNLEFRNFNPPQRVIGEAIKDRLGIVQTANKQAAKQLDSVAKSLQGQAIDVSPAINKFLDDLADEGIDFNPARGTLDFSNSTIEGLTDAQGIIKRMVKRLYNTADPTQNAYDVHRAKRFIDEQVTFGKTQGGLSGKMDNILKSLRHNLDGILDQNFPEYDKVNSIYAETRGLIDEVQSLAGNKVDLYGQNVDKALGVMSRKVLSNYASGTAMEDMFSQLDDVARRYSTPLSGGTDDELKKLVSLEAEIRKMFKTAVKPNTFMGETITGTAHGVADLATGNKIGLFQKATDAAGKVFSKSDEKKIQALKDLLSEQKLK